MLLFKDRDPMEDLIDIIVATNPDLDGVITVDNITLQYVVAQSTAEENETGYNTRAMLMGRGDLSSVVGTRYVYWNRINLADVYPDNTLRVRASSVSGVVKGTAITAGVAKTLGTAINRVGLFVDNSEPGNRALGSGLTFSGYPIYLSAYSLRYKPGTFKIILESLGDDLAENVSDQGVFPFYNETTRVVNIEAPNTLTSYNPRYVDDVTRSYMHTMGRINWSYVWGNDPASVIEDNPEGGYMFTEAGFGKINALLEVYGLPPLVNKYFSSYNISSSGKTEDWFSSAIPTETTARLFIHYNNLDYNYYELYNLKTEGPNGQTSSKYGVSPDTGLIFVY